MAGILYFQKFENAEQEDLTNEMDEVNEIPDPRDAFFANTTYIKDEDSDSNFINLREQLLKHVNSSVVEERQMLGKLLASVFQSYIKLNYSEDIDDILEAIDKISCDTHQIVRLSLVEYLPHVALICHDSPDLIDKGVINRILNIILTYVRDEDREVRRDAQTALKLLLERNLLDIDQIQQSVCPVIIQLSCDQQTSYQNFALTLMTKVNQYIGDEQTEKLFLDRFLELCKNHNLFVRKMCASIIGEFCTIMSKETIHNQLLKTYTMLCLDDAWDVRKASVDVMMSVARCMTLPIRRHLLAKLLASHLNDESDWVKNSAYEILGPFISTFAKQFHGLICDQKGELVLMHETERGWPRFNVVPAAKASDMYTENFSNRIGSADNNHWKGDPIYEAAVDIYGESDRNGKPLEKNNRFNVFQYYYDPPDAPLDPNLVESIISDSEKMDMVNMDAKWVYNANKNSQHQDMISNKIECDDQENEIKSQKSNQQEKDNNENIDNNEQQQPQQDSNDNELDVELQDQSQLDADLEQFLCDYDEGQQNYYTENRFTRVCSLSTKVSKCPPNLNCTVNLSNSSKQSSSTINNLRLSIFWFLSNMNNAKNEKLEENTDEIVPQILIDHFILMSSPEIDQNFNYHCAFSFPAVVLTVGKEQWYRLKDAYRRLAGAMAWKVRSTLASGIHEIAIIIEKEYAARDLVPIYNDFIKDLDEVRIGALKHFSTFLTVLSPEDRNQYLLKLDNFLIHDNKWNWRLREELVKQLSDIIHLYQRLQVAKYIAPLLLHLMQDTIAAVRQEALDAVVKTIAYLSCNGDDPLAIAMIQEMRDQLMHATKRWVIRQIYALICSKLIRNRIVSDEVFVRELLPFLLILSKDKVPNVRLVVARTLARDIITIHNFAEPKVMNEVQQKLKKMQSDCDRDVRAFACEVEID